ncbi:BBP7 family outer membrane beta-barrel protein [Planctomycetes bacterium TBK1r]|uniref:BBP7 family outer membrane beta-barrel protein n=1 Tax=Stieleria magnilauensis TaxID=2527963 RepID=UPI0011A00716
MFGYSILYLNDIARADDQIDLSVNTSQIPPGVVGAARPALAFRCTDFWPQGVTLWAGVVARMNQPTATKTRVDRHVRLLVN